MLLSSPTKVHLEEIKTHSTCFLEHSLSERAVSSEQKKAWWRRRVSLICRNFAALESLSNPQKITCIIFENLFVPYFLPHQSHSYGYAPSSGENLTSKMSFKSDATYYFHIT
ncbi:MAG: hypothetical protein PUD98_05725, partial [Bacteroidales bacterium]|nr:hypothetical protein [Bacteroidales bacterium]